MPELENGAFIRHGMRMRYRALIAWFSDQDAAVIGIQRTAEHIEKKIALAHKADAETFAVLGPGGGACSTFALKVKDLVKIRFV